MERLSGDFALAAWVAAVAGNLRCVFVVFAVGAAVFLVGHTGTGGVSAFLLISHRLISPRISNRSILGLGCDLAAVIWQV